MPSKQMGESKSLFEDKAYTNYWIILVLQLLVVVSLQVNSFSVKCFVGMFWPLRSLEEKKKKKCFFKSDKQ